MLKKGLGYEALLAAVLGIFCGLFFGSMCTVLEPIGEIFVMLLQMVVLPYIPSVIMHGLGSLSPQTAKKLFSRGWYFLLLLWGVVFVVIYSLSVLIPTPLPDPSGDYTRELIHFEKNFLAFIVPQNPFYDLVNNIVPAIAIFSVIMGVAFMHLKEKDPLLSLLERTNTSLERIFKWLAAVSPIAIFAHIAHATGTVNLEDLAKLETYVITFILSTLFLSLWVLPMILSCLTSIPYRELMREFRIVCTLAFATGIPSIAFPFINNCMRRLAERENLELATFRHNAQTVVPLAYSFAQVGNLFLLFFLFFMSFFFRHPFTEAENVILPLFTIPISFGTPQLSLSGMSFLIDSLKFPREAFNLFVETMAVTLNFQVLLSVAGMLTFNILVVLHYYGLLNVNWKRLATHVSAMAAVLIGSVFITSQFLDIRDNYGDLYYTRRISDVIKNPPKVTFHTTRPTVPIDRTADPLARILKTGILRVGYDVANIPFCYLNKWDEMVGYDIAIAYQLAKDLDASLEFVPLSYDTLGEDIENGYFDIAMSAILVDEERLLKMDFCHTYMEQINALVVPVARLNEFRRLPEIEKESNLRIGAFGGYRLVVNRHFTAGQLVQVQDINAIVKGQIDAMMWSELPAYIWCLAHPEYTTLTYQKNLGMKFFAYPVKSGAMDLIQFVNQWMDLKRQSGFMEEQRDYWIRGRPAPPYLPRWSLIRDVLHWVD